MFIRSMRSVATHHQQELGEAEHVFAVLAPGEHHPNALPREEEGGKGQEHPSPDVDELRLARLQQRGNCLLHRPDGVVTSRRHHSHPYGCCQVSSRSAVLSNISLPYRWP